LALWSTVMFHAGWISAQFATFFPG
jgi:hypothetical protein